jgi:hypothetical protein
MGTDFLGEIFGLFFTKNIEKILEKCFWRIVFGLIFGKLCQVFEITKWGGKKTMVMGFPTPLICWSSKLIQAFHPVLDLFFFFVCWYWRGGIEIKALLIFVFYFFFETKH